MRRRSLPTTASAPVAEVTATEAKADDIYGVQEPDSGTFSSGCSLLDKVLGGGWKLNRIANIVGDRSTGKTLLAIEACANYLKTIPNGRIVYVETEAAFDKAYASNLGLPLDKVDFPNDSPERAEYLDTVEAVFEHLEKRLEDSSTPQLYIIDSLDALSSRDELSRGISDASFGGEKSKKLSELFRRLNSRVSRSNITILVISQIRDNIGAMFGEKHKRSGGKALDFYATHVVWLAHIGQIKKTRNKVERTIGVTVRANCKKNKVGPPFRSCDFPVIFDYGIEDTQAGLDWLIKVERTEELGLTKEQAKKLGDKLDRLSADEYQQERNNVASAVTKVWQEIEAEFAPKRKKYE